MPESQRGEGLYTTRPIAVSDFGKEPVRYRFVWVIYKWEDGWSTRPPERVMRRNAENPCRPWICRRVSARR